MALVLYDYIDDTSKLENYDKTNHVAVLIKAGNFQRIKQLFGNDQQVRDQLHTEYAKDYVIDVDFSNNFFSDTTEISLVMPNMLKINSLADILDIDMETRKDKLIDAIKKADIDTKISSLFTSNDVYDITIPHYVLSVMKERGYGLPKTILAMKQKYQELNSHDVTSKINRGEKTITAHVSDLKKMHELINQFRKLSA